jgi:hypothetical protein
MFPPSGNCYPGRCSPLFCQPSCVNRFVKRLVSSRVLGIGEGRPEAAAGSVFLNLEDEAILRLRLNSRAVPTSYHHFLNLCLVASAFTRYEFAHDFSPRNTLTPINYG